MTEREFLDDKVAKLEIVMEEMLPKHMHQAVYDWLWKGWMPGDFLSGVIANDLRAAALHADSMNARCLADWAKFFVWYMPQSSWGSDENLKAWHEMGGCLGLPS